MFWSIIEKVHGKYVLRKKNEQILIFSSKINLSVTYNIQEPFEVPITSQTD